VRGDEVDSLRRKELAMTETDIDKLLRSALVGRLGLCKDNEPYVVPLNYAYEKNHIYFHCAETGTKMEYLHQNPAVCFEVDEHITTMTAPVPCDCSTVYRSVIVFGTAQIVTDLEEKAAALRLIVTKYVGIENAQKLGTATVDRYRSGHGSKTMVVKITIKVITGKHYGIAQQET